MENQNYADCVRCEHMTVLFGLPRPYCRHDKNEIHSIHLRDFEFAPEWCPLEKKEQK